MFKSKEKQLKSLSISGQVIFKLIENMANTEGAELSDYMPVIKRINQDITREYERVCCKGIDENREQSPVLSNFQMGFFQNIFSYIAVCNYKAAWESFYSFAKCDKWPIKGYMLSSQEIICTKFILNAFEFAEKMPGIFVYELLHNNGRD